MMKKESQKEAAPPKRNDPNADQSTDIIADFEAAVKRNDLRTALSLAEVTPKEAAIILRKYFPSIDKTVLSKCCNADKYGCVLHPDGYALLGKFCGVCAASPSAPRRARLGSGHKLTCRISARLADGDYAQLQRYVSLEGYKTMQDWIVSRVKIYLKDMEAAYGAET